uniref:Uncharacterized protein n=1 Tax=Acrobeloides nanus TaxID=290746 RepID=A0A914BXA7_9BILA
MSIYANSGGQSAELSNWHLSKFGMLLSITSVCDLKGQAEENEEKIDTGHSRTSTELNVAQTMAKSPEGPFINARARSIIFNVQTTGFDKKYFPGDRL